MLHSGESLFVEVYDQPTERLARLATEIGSQAWHERFQSRGEVGVQQVFDPRDPTKLYNKMVAARRTAGQFACAVAVVHDGETMAPVGVAWGAGDISGTAWERFAKRRIYGREPYAWLAQHTVLPIYQQQAIGASTLDVFLNQFKPEQQPTAYVFDENRPALQWYRDKLGFAARPDTPVEKQYFGPDSEPVLQWRLEAESVALVRGSIQTLYENLPIDDVRQKSDI